MILYFSATGNSEYAAKRIGKETDDDVTGLFERIRSGDYSEIHSQRPWVIVAPTYAWRIPRILQQAETHLSQRKQRDLLCDDLRRKHRKCRQISGETVRRKENELPGMYEDYDARKLYRSVHHADSRGGGGNHPAGGNRHRRRRTLHQK